MQQSKTFFNAKLLFSIAILFSFFTIGCTDNTTDPPPETILLKGWVQYNENKSDSMEILFEYDGDKIKNAKRIDRESLYDITYTYEASSLSKINILQLEDNKRVNIVLNYEYSNNKLFKVTGTENGTVSYLCNYYYVNNNLDKVIALKYDGTNIVDSTVCSSFDLIAQRPGMIQHYYNYNKSELYLSESEKFTYSNGNTTLKETISFDSEGEMYGEHLTKYFYNNEKSIMLGIKEFILTSDNVPYMANNIDKNNVNKIEIYSKNCNSEISENFVIISELNALYTKNSANLVEKINFNSVEYCSNNPYSYEVKIKY